MSAGMDVLIGLARCARFRADGIARFGDTPAAFLISLAPLLGLSLAGCASTAFAGAAREALTLFLVLLILLLGQAVVSHLFAQMWRREPRWLRYATAYNWCQWLLFAALLVARGAGALLSGAGVAATAAYGATAQAFGLYALALLYFLVWRGLDLSPWRALLATIGINLATALPVLLLLRTTASP